MLGFILHCSSRLHLVPAQVPPRQKSHAFTARRGTDTDPWPQIKGRALYELQKQLAANLRAARKWAQKAAQTIEGIVAHVLMRLQPPVQCLESGFDLGDGVRWPDRPGCELLIGRD